MHWPSVYSGVTVGPGYSMKDRGKSPLDYKKEKTEFIVLISNGIEGAKKFRQIELATAV